MIAIYVQKTQARAELDAPVTSGSVGREVQFQFSDDWAGLSKTAVFETNNYKECAAVPESGTIAIPADVLAYSGYQLRIGVIGKSADGTTVIPTVYADCDAIKTGASTVPMGTPPTPSQAEQLQAQIDALATLTLGQHTDGLIYIFIGGKPVGNGLSITSGEVVDPVYGDPVVDNAILSIAKGQTIQLGVMLDKEPTQKQTITILSDNDALTFDKTVLTFTPDDWNVMQFVSVTCGAISEDGATTITLRNSDKLLTDTAIAIYLLADAYAVDTTIPTEGQHICTLDDFEKTSNYGDYIRLYNYIGEYDNIVIPSTLGGKIPWVCCSNDGVTTSSGTFVNTKELLKYVTFEDGVIYRGAGVTSGVDAGGLFGGHTSLIGVAGMNPETSNMSGAFIGCTSLRFVKGIENLTKCTNFSRTFKDSGIEYIPDLSKIEGVTGIGEFCRNATALKRVYGMPKCLSTAKMTNAFNGCTSLEKAEVPENITDLTFTFMNCASLREVVVHSTDVTSASAFSGCSDLKVYVPADSTTYSNMVSEYGSSTAVTILTGLPGNATSLPVIAVWGDSTSSPNRTWKEWPARLQEVVESYTVKNQALSGEFTTSTSARQGGNALRVGAFTIPADTSQVAITLTSADGQTFGTSPVFSTGASFNPCTIAGVQGTIVNAGGGVYKFARRVAGEAVEVADGTAVTSDADSLFNNADAVMLVNLGINAGWNTNADTLLNQVQMMVNHFTAAGGTKYIITGPYAGQFLVNDSDRQVVFSYETKAANAFGEHWLNLREYLIENGLTENGLTASALDTERMAVGQVPASLLGAGSVDNIGIYDGVNNTDQTHPNAHGQNSIFNAFYAKGQSLGYWN